MQKITSSFLSLNTQDILKGAIVAAASTVFSMVAESVEKGQFIFDFTSIWHTGVAAGVAYLGKQLFTPASIISAKL